MDVVCLERPFDVMIGRLDRLLSEFLIAVKSNLDAADLQTIKHHADDLIGVGGAALKAVAASTKPTESGTEK